MEGEKESGKEERKETLIMEGGGMSDLAKGSKLMVGMKTKYCGGGLRAWSGCRLGFEASTRSKQ